MRAMPNGKTQNGLTITMMTMTIIATVGISLIMRKYLAGLSFLAAYMPKHPIKESKEIVKQLIVRRNFKRKQAEVAKSAAIKAS